MGVCCIVFDIDGMLFEFVMNFFNIEIYKNLNFIFFQNFMFSLRFMLFPTFKKKIVSTKIIFILSLIRFSIIFNTGLSTREYNLNIIPPIYAYHIIL